MTASSPLRNAAPRPGATRAPLTALRGGVSGPSGLSQDLFDTLATRIESTLLISKTTTKIIISWTELGRAMAFVVRLAWWAALKFALCNVLAYGGYRVLGYVLPFLRFAPYR